MKEGRYLGECSIVMLHRREKVRLTRLVTMINKTTLGLSTSSRP